MRGVDVFLKAMPAASVRQLMMGPREIGPTDYYHVANTEILMDSKRFLVKAGLWP